MVQTFDTPLFSSDQSIDRVLKTGLPVLLVILNGTAGPALDQAMKTLAKQEAGKLLVVQMDAKDSPAAAQKYHISQTPAVVSIKNGQVQSEAQSIDAGALVRHANYLLGKGPKPEIQPQRAAAQAAGAATAGGYSSGASYNTGAAGGHPVTVTDATFEQEVMRSSIPVVVDFWAPWCGPCRMVAPTLDKLAVEWSGKAKIAKVNVDENPMIAGRYGITGIPTMMVVKDGKIADRWAGALPEPALRSRLSTFVH